MFFGKLFPKKDHRYYLNQAEKYLKAERWADARASLLEAADRAAGADSPLIQEGLDRACDGLAELNFSEGVGAFNAGDHAKAMEHFKQTLDFAADPELRQRSERELARLQRLAFAQPAKAQAQPAHQHHGGGCASCSGHGDSAELEDFTASHLSDEERFHLMVQPLPGDLPARYAVMGEEFARAYRAIHDGDDRTALDLLERLCISQEDDIINCEIALIMYRAGRHDECEAFLDRSLQLNPANPLTNLTKVQFAVGAGRYAEAIATVERMQELDILTDQTHLMLGEIHAEAGDLPAAIENWSKALDHPSVARAAAEKLVPLLSGMGRTQDAQYLAKRYLKGCC